MMNKREDNVPFIFDKSKEKKMISADNTSGELGGIQMGSSHNELGIFSMPKRAEMQLSLN